MRREQFITDASQYVSRLRKHMSWEEDDLFRRIDTMIGEEAHAVDVSDFLHIKDPVFELEIEAGFRRLLGSLKAV